MTTKFKSCIAALAVIIGANPAHARIWLSHSYGWSNYPVMAYSERLVMHDAPYPALCAGDFVQYRNWQGKLVCHQLRRKTPYGWVAQGVNNAHPDIALVTPTNYVGRVLSHEHDTHPDQAVARR